VLALPLVILFEEHRADQADGDFYLPAIEAAERIVGGRRLSRSLLKVRLGFRDRGPGPVALRLRGGCRLPEQKPAHVAGDVGEADLGARSGDANGADEQPHAVLLVGEDMLDAGAFP
jgi:hypothetical protein